MRRRTPAQRARAAAASRLDDPLKLVQRQLHERQAVLEEAFQRLVGDPFEDRHEEPEGVLLAHVQQEQAGDEAHALDVAHLAVVHRVGFEHVVQLPLPEAVALVVVYMIRERAGDVSDDLDLRRALLVHHQLAIGGAMGGAESQAEGPAAETCGRRAGPGER